jgi:hypothetical protein
MMESLLAFKRAGADGVLTYFARDAARNQQLPSRFDYTSMYDLLVFRRLSSGRGRSCASPVSDRRAPARAPQARRSAGAAAH